MHIHILGICGTFMGGIALLAKQAGYRVTGCDANVYPPMSTQLESQGIELIQGFSPEQIGIHPDIFIIGNVISRGNPLIEEILNRNLPYLSGPQWLAQYLLQDKWVLAVAGTHGKTTTSSMLAWMLEYSGMKPGFLIGGIPQNFGVSARLTDSSFFVIEADEYDTAFFDKRSKFIHYHPRTVILNNLEFDHADIFPDLDSIETQFHHLIRTIPGNGLIICNGREEALSRVIRRGCWTPVELFGCPGGWDIDTHNHIIFSGNAHGKLQLDLMGEHNRLNALAAISAARHAGVPVTQSLSALKEFKNVKRRMEVRGMVNGITVYDDFAHHPTAIATTLSGLRAKTGNARIMAVLEPRSNTMKLGVMRNSLPASLREADMIFCYNSSLGWDARAIFSQLGQRAIVTDQMDELIAAIATAARPGDHILIMSNGEFGGIHEKLLKRLWTLEKE
uniref:UDP-N-acetylmuramate--L-alanyl-gamma-D-glutamyl-meso-2,6-diaminoheptandioate ligase n=1 Tax=Candidatus Nitrotoga fabula TaxID=2182327 RepID=A0A2X0QXA9_9PROT|nr:UDP-N-acetylmuramate:L-alanyl-gamma-D-glutamyl-meso-diaminopimelate ligase [Candidatus Nitrotoga fabula]